LKIGIVTEFHYPTIGGIQEHIHFFHAELIRMGYEVAVMTSKVSDTVIPPGEEMTDPGKVIHLGKSRLFQANGSASRVTTGWNLPRQFRDVLRAEKFDLLHVHTPFVPVLPMLALKEAQVPVVGTFHTNFGSKGDSFIKKFMPLMRHYLDRLDARIAVSQTSADTMAEHFGGRYKVIPNGVDLNGFSAGKPYEQYRDGHFNLLFVGRLDPRNGLDEMIVAAAKAGARIPIRLLIMGDGPERKRYETLAREFLGDKAVFLGTRLATRPHWYATADALCAPMHVASFGLVLIEAMAAGLPLIANRIQGFSDVIEDGRQGIFVDTGDTAAFADAISNLAGNSSLRDHLIAEGRKKVQKYAWNRIAEQVIDVYRESLGLTAVLKRSA
jgi:phosphatidylinositol alpha-mannosyltransferase